MREKGRRETGGGREVFLSIKKTQQGLNEEDFFRLQLRKEAEGEKRRRRMLGPGKGGEELRKRGR
jgi:hypothetical protein